MSQKDEFHPRVKSLPHPSSLLRLLTRMTQKLILAERRLSCQRRPCGAFVLRWSEHGLFICQEVLRSSWTGSVNKIPAARAVGKDTQILLHFSPCIHFLLFNLRYPPILQLLYPWTCPLAEARSMRSIARPHLFIPPPPPTPHRLMYITPDGLLPSTIVQPSHFSTWHCFNATMQKI